MRKNVKKLKLECVEKIKMKARSVNTDQSEFPSTGSKRMRVVVIASGSSGNCVAVSSEERILLLDCGLSASTCFTLLAHQWMNPDNIAGVLLTHEHGDHAKGAHQVCSRTGAVLCTMPKTAEAIGGVSFIPPPTTIAGCEVESFPVPHDCQDPVGFIVRTDGKSIGYCTDAGYVTKLMFEKLKEVQLLIIESNHDERMLKAGGKHEVVKSRVNGGHGHLSNKAAAELLGRLSYEGKLTHAILFHLSKDSNTPELALHECRTAAPDLEIEVERFGLSVTI